MESNKTHAVNCPGGVLTGDIIITTLQLALDHHKPDCCAVDTDAGHIISLGNGLIFPALEIRGCKGLEQLRFYLQYRSHKIDKLGLACFFDCRLWLQRRSITARVKVCPAATWREWFHTSIWIGINNLLFLIWQFGNWLSPEA